MTEKNDKVNWEKYRDNVRGFFFGENGMIFKNQKLG